MKTIENGLADKELTAVDMSDVGLEEKRSILEIFLNCHSSGSDYNSQKQTPSDCSNMSSSAKTRSFNSYLDKSMMKPKLKRHLSDSFAFLHDSLVANLFQDYRVKNSQDHKDSAPDWKLSNKTNSVEECCLTSSYRVKNSSCPSLHDKDSYFFQSLHQTSGIRKNEAEQYSYDILDVTLPVLNRSQRQNKPNRFYVLNATPVPRLRRCRSLTNDYSAFHYATKSASNSVDENALIEKKNCRRLSYQSTASAIPATQALSAFSFRNSQANNCIFEDELLSDHFLRSSTPKSLAKASKTSKYLQKQCANQSVDLFCSPESVEEILHSRIMHSIPSSDNHPNVFNNSADMFL